MVRLAVGALLLALGALSLGAGVSLGTHVAAVPAGAGVAGQAPTAAPPATAAPVETPVPAESPAAPPAATPLPTPTPRSPAALEARVAQLLRQDEVSAGVSLVELTGAAHTSWSLDGDQQFVAASTYELPLLMEEAQNVTAGHASPNDELCYDAGDWEDGYYSDYQPGDCYTRAGLERRVGIDSDNTAAHILVRYDGGAAALNAYARAH